MPFAAALSEHPIAIEAAGEVVGTVLERLGGGCDLAVLCTTAAHTDAVEAIAATVQAALAPKALLGASAVSVLGGRREVESAPAVSLFGARFATGSLPPMAMHLEAVPGHDGMTLTGMHPSVDDAAALLLVADPLSFPTDAVLAAIDRDRPGLTVIGGIASASFAPGGNRLVHGTQVASRGAVAVAIPPGAVHVSPIVSQGCRPIGVPVTVTAVAGPNNVAALAGQPALTHLRSLLDRLGPDDRSLASDGLHLGRVIDEHQLDFGRGDFLVRNVIGADRESATIAVAGEVAVGDTVQFQVRDADTADDDLRALLTGRQADGALVFTCNGRGQQLFGRPDHDAEVVADLTGTTAVAGMFCAGEIGPIGGRSFVHGFTASMALLRDLHPS